VQELRQFPDVEERKSFINAKRAQLFSEMSIHGHLSKPSAEVFQLSSRLTLTSEIGHKENTMGDTINSTNFESVVTGLGVSDIFGDEPEVTPMRSQSPQVKRDSLNRSIEINDECEAGRGRVQAAGAGAALSAKAAKKKRRKQNMEKASPAMSTVRGFTPGDSGAEDSDYARGSSKIKSPIPRPRPLAGASPGIRPASPAVSSLKLQLDALNLGSRPGSRSTSLARSKLGSDTPSSELSSTSEPGTEDDLTSEMISYEVPLDQDFVNPALKETTDQHSSSLSTLCPDQRASSMMSRKMTAADFTTLKCLGKGTYGTVHLVKQHSSNRLFAQKQFRKASLTVHKKLVEQTKTERSILESVNRHPFIVNLYYAFQDCEKLYLILEYAQGGELFHHLEMEKFFSEDIAAFYMAEMILALDHLHHNVGVIYRDLKPENCLLDSEGHLLLTDFGLSKVAVEDPSTPGSSRCNSTGIGTIEYMAPEVIRGSELSAIGPGYGKQCDWWSLGALGFDLLTGSPPFGGNNYTKIQQNIVKQKLSLPYFLSPDAKDLLTRLLRKEPNKRLGAKGKADVAIMKKHRFFRKINWTQLERRELEPPIRPLITDPELAENFSTDFTNLAVSPAMERFSEGLSSTDPFGGFSYVASSSLLEAGYLDDEEDFGL
jgi:serine/threonine-protein kinase Psk1